MNTINSEKTKVISTLNWDYFWETISQLVGSYQMLTLENEATKVFLNKLGYPSFDDIENLKFKFSDLNRKEMDEVIDGLNKWFQVTGAWFSVKDEMKVNSDREKILDYRYDIYAPKERNRETIKKNLMEMFRAPAKLNNGRFFFGDKCHQTSRYQIDDVLSSDPHEMLMICKMYNLIIAANYYYYFHDRSLDKIAECFKITKVEASKRLKVEVELLLSVYTGRKLL